MKLVFFSDLHVHPFPEFGADDRLKDSISVLSDIRAHCIEHKIRHVFFGGDLFHVRGVVRTRPYVQVTNELSAFRDAGITFYAVDGNHDHEDAEGTTHALQPLIAGGLVKGISRKGYRVVNVGDCWVTMFAYCDSREMLAKRIRASRSQRDKKEHSIALFHHGFKGARVGSTLEYEVKEPIDARELKLDKLYQLVLSGHYHTHQAIEGIRNGWYVGSPLEHTRSDRSEEAKGFLVVDTETMEFERVPLNRPRFVTLNCNERPKANHITGNFVDVVYKRADELLDALVDEIKAMGARGVNPVPLPKAKTSKKRLNVSPTLSPGKVLKRYVKFRTKDIKRQRLDRAALLRLGLELVRETEQK